METDLLTSATRVTRRAGPRFLAGFLVIWALLLICSLAAAKEVAIYFVHSDQLGTPQKLTDETGTVVWAAQYDPFGHASVQSDTVSNSNRLPGQFVDAETGFQYNHFRDYEPSTGRYLQSDPIRLNGGINTYLYVNANPIRFIDPMGLLVWQGKFFYFGGSEILGGGRFIFNLISECVDGKQVQVRVIVNAAGVDIGSPVSGVGGALDFDDARSVPDPAAFEKEFLYIGVSAAYGIGGSLSAMSFDRGSIQSNGLSLVGGIDLSLFTELKGTGRLNQPVKTYDCSCGKVRRIY